MQIAKLSSKNQITLPKKFLLELGIQPREKLLIEKEGEKIIIKKAKKTIVEETFKSLRRYVSKNKIKATFPQIMQKTKQKVAKKLVKNS